MAKGIVIYYSRSGNTEKMAQIIAEAMNEAGLSTDITSVQDVNIDSIVDYDAIVVGSPTYYGQMSAEIKKLFDDLVSKHGQLDGKVGAAFSSSGNIGGGNETTVLGILQAMLISGMTVPGDAKGDHYGPISVGSPDERSKGECERRGRRVAELCERLFG
jgi:NAD(P)H dehydrogenase (quinone)